MLLWRSCSTVKQHHHTTKGIPHLIGLQSLQRVVVGFSESLTHANIPNMPSYEYLLSACASEPNQRAVKNRLAMHPRPAIGVRCG